MNSPRSFEGDTYAREAFKNTRVILKEFYKKISSTVDKEDLVELLCNLPLWKACCTGTNQLPNKLYKEIPDELLLLLH